MGCNERTELTAIVTAPCNTQRKAALSVVLSLGLQHLLLNGNSKVGISLGDPLGYSGLLTSQISRKKRHHYCITENDSDYQEKIMADTKQRVELYV